MLFDGQQPIGASPIGGSGATICHVNDNDYGVFVSIVLASMLLLATIDSAISGEKWQIG